MTVVSAAAAAAGHGQSQLDERPVSRLAAFALAGMAIFGLVLDQYDVPHDNAQGAMVLGAGALAGVVAAIAVRFRPALGQRATRIAWDTVRFVLAYEMVRYGVPKLIGMQFYPQYFRWDGRVIDQSAKALAWEFLGRSYAYQAFGGVIEVGSAVLLCFRRTTLLGACLLATALVNVVLINVLYGVPVKLFASVYLLFDAALIARHGGRLWALFLAPVERIDRGRLARWAHGLLLALVIVVPAATAVREGIALRVFEREPLEGAWSVDERSGAAPADWERLYFEKGDVGFVRAGKDLVPFRKQLDGAQLRLSIAGSAASDPHARSIPGAGGLAHLARGTIAVEGRTVRVEGTCDDQPCAMKLTREFPQ